MSPLEALAEELGAIASRIDRDTSLRLDAALANLRSVSAEQELRFERLERALNDRIASVKDGDSVTPEQLAPMVDAAVRAAVEAASTAARASISTEIAERVAAIPPVEAPVAATAEEVAEALHEDMLKAVEAEVVARVALIEVPPASVDKDALAEAAREAVAALPVPKDGDDVDIEVVRALIVEEVGKIKAPADGHTPTAEEIEAVVSEVVGKAFEAANLKEWTREDMETVARESVATALQVYPGAEQLRSVVETSEKVPALVSEAVEKAVSTIEVPQVDPAEVKAAVDEAVSALDLPTEVSVGALVDKAVDVAVKAIPRAKDGDTPTPEAVRAVVEEVVKAAVEALPEPEPGKSVDPEEVRAMVEKAVAEIPKPKDGQDGKLPVVKAWEDRVYYEGEVCSHDGATYQASADTGRAPPHDDWTCIAAKGAPGKDAAEIAPMRTYDPEAEYKRLSIVTLNGASFIALHDEPGPCPGEGWQLMAQQGKRGKPGEVKAADAGTRPKEMSVTSDGVLILTMDDGTVVDCDLYPLLSRLS